MTKTILITGSQGYLGSFLVPYLDAKGYRTIGIDTGFFHDQTITTDDKKLLKHTYINLDVRDFTENLLNNVDVVVHLAGISNDPMSMMDEKKVYDPTRDYSKKIATMCKEKGIKFIFASSCSVYGIGSDELLTEDSKPNPQTGYSLNKYQIEIDLAKLSNKNFSPIALRFATVFGPSKRMRFDLVINMLLGMAVSRNKIILNSDGKSWRPNLHIEDLCQSILCSINLEYNEGKLLILNVGDEENNLQIITIAKRINEIYNSAELSYLTKDPNQDPDNLIKDRKVKGKDTRTYKVSFAKIRKVFPEFKCKWSVKEGIRDLGIYLEKVNLTDDTFRERGFYRLQHLEYLIENNLITEDLRWTNKN
mgnify:CR=1 FL=1